jgi:hypothetical protein
MYTGAKNSPHLHFSAAFANGVIVQPRLLAKAFFRPRLRKSMAVC